MRIPRWLVLVAVLVPATAQADDHRADLYAGFGYARLYFEAKRPQMFRDLRSSFGFAVR